MKCSNCVLYEGNGVCKIIAGSVEDNGKCRFAVIPDGVVEIDNEDNDDDLEEELSSIAKNLKENKMIIELPYDNVQIVKRKHDAMKAWHEDMAKSHQQAAEWHAEQSDELGKAMKEVPLNPEERSGQVYGTRGSSTDKPDAPAPAATKVPLDPVKKADLIQILADHVEEYGDLGLSPEEIVDKIFGE